MESLISTGEAATILELTRQGVNDLIKRGLLTPAQRVGTRGDQLLNRAEVEALAAERSKERVS